jgi:glycosyltransferase involved in cell wall biosynthesis
MSAPNKTLLYLETRMTGHRPSYLRRIVNIAIEQEYRVLLAMPQGCFEHSVSKQLLSGSSPGELLPIHCNPLDTENATSSNARMLYNEYLCSRFYREAMTKARNYDEIDIVVAAMFDDASIYCGLFKFDFSGIPWLGIIMRQNFHFAAMGVIGPPETRMVSVKRYLFLRLLRSLKSTACLLTIDRTLKEYTSRYHKNLAERIEFLPDAVDDRGKVSNPEIRKELSIPQDAFVILCYGTLRENKGVELLVDAMRQLPETVHALLVGTQHPTIRQYINKEIHQPLLLSGRIHQVDRYIELSEDPSFFNAANIVWVAYKDYYSMSAVLIQAAQYRKPVLATHKGLIGKLTLEYNTGEVVDTSSIDEVLRGINRLKQDTMHPVTRHYERLVAEHNLTSFENALIAAFRKVTVSSSYH